MQKFQPNIKLRVNKDPLTGLADSLKAATWSSHREAEKSGVISQILKQDISRQNYIDYICALHFIYEALEDQLRRVDLPDCLLFLADTRLFRTASLHKDLKALGVTDLFQSHSAASSARDYSSLIKTDMKTNVLSALGHAYVRYLGDLNGGQILKTLLKKSLNLTDDSLNFYEFPEIDNVIDFRDAYRTNINGVVLSLEDQAIVISAAKGAFRMNIALSQEICKS